ncbi:MAG: hypothetical protein IJ033_01875 [Clostridia bacterium]|nr:hypothetical protein [Clostridia bacterium]
MQKKFWNKKNIIITVIVSLVVIALIVAIVVISLENKEVKTAEASVTRGSLSTSISASGVVTTAGINESIPLFACVNNITDYETITDYTADDFSWNYAIINSSTAPIVYEVTYVNADLRNVKSIFRTTDENVVIMEVMPYYLDWSKLEDAKDNAILNGQLKEGSTTSDFLFMLLLSEKDNPLYIPSEYLRISTNADDKVSIDTDYLVSIIEKVAATEEMNSLEYSISNLKVKEGDSITVDQNVFKLALSQLYTSFTVTEYDVADIDAKLRGGEKVYAGVTVNALGGRKVIAEIQEIIKGSYSSGIAYYAVKAKIVFGLEANLDLTDEENLLSSAAQVALSKGHKSLSYADFSYYDSYLTPEVVEALGVDITDRVEREEVLENYSVAIRVQKTAVIDKLIIPTKCIFYDDAKNPYVLVTRDNKEVRVYVKVLLSTGSEAAVEVKDAKQDGALAEGDKIIYQADSSLISSILG